MVDTPASIADDSISATNGLRQRVQAPSCEGLRTTLQTDEECEQHDGGSVLPVRIVRWVCDCPRVSDNQREGSDAR